MDTFQMVRIGDILDLPSVDGSDGTGEVLVYAQDDIYSIDTIHYGIEKYGLWKTGVIQVKMEYHGPNYFIHGDGHHRLAYLYMMLGEEGYIPVRFTEGDYMNQHPCADKPLPSQDTLPVPFTIDELMAFSKEMSD